MYATGSISKGKLATKHNLRSCYDACSCPANIDLARSAENEVLVSRDIADVYAEAFGDALAAYNAGQVAKRHPERQIPDYLEHVRADKKLNEAYEFVVQVGNIDQRPPDDLCASILRDFEAEFEKTYGERFRVGQAVIHMDEATPHMHMQVVPVAESTRGLALQNSLNKAVQQAGFADYKSMLMGWDEILTGCMAEHGVEHVIGDKERQRGGVDIDTYRKAMRLAETCDAAERDVDAELAEKRAELEDLTARLESVRQRESADRKRHSELVGELGSLQGRAEFAAGHPETLAEGARALAGARGIGERESIARERNQGLRSRISELRDRISALLPVAKPKASAAIEAGWSESIAQANDRLERQRRELGIRIEALEQGNRSSIERGSEAARGRFEALGERESIARERNQGLRSRISELRDRKQAAASRNQQLRGWLPKYRAKAARVKKVLASPPEVRAAWKKDFLRRNPRWDNTRAKKTKQQRQLSTGPSRRGDPSRGQQQSRGRSR